MGGFVIKLFSFLQDKLLPWLPDQFPLPWDASYTPIYDAVTTDPQAELPDTGRLFKPGDLRYVDGAFDNIFGGGANNDEASKVYAALSAFLKRPTSARLSRLYGELSDRKASDYIDTLFDFIASGALDRQRVQDLFRWICRTAPDREPVKAGLAILGICRDAANVPLFQALGRNEEFSLFVINALANTLDHPETEIWALARQLTGWGKVNAVERLAGTTDPQVKRWLVREGCANAIMDAYLAYICATSGDLISALRQTEIDEALLWGAADILEALFEAGPCETMKDYAEGAEAVERFIEHLDRAALPLRLCRSLVCIRQALTDEAVELSEAQGWTLSRKETLTVRIDDILRKQDLTARVERDFLSSAHQRFYDAITLAEYLCMDVWPIYWARQKAGMDSWYYLMRSGDPTQIDQVLGLAREQLNLSALPSEPTPHVVYNGPGMKSLDELDFIVSRLNNFPGQGFDLIVCALRAPPVRNRNMATKALAAWGLENWPEEAAAALKAAIAKEPDEKLRATMQRVLKGEPFSIQEVNIS